MEEEITKLILKRNQLNEKLKSIKAEINDKIVATQMYATVLESSVLTVDEHAFEVSEKDAAKHALKVTLKSYESMIPKE